MQHQLQQANQQRQHRLRRPSTAPLGHLVSHTCPRASKSLPSPVEENLCLHIPYHKPKHKLEAAQCNSLLPVDILRRKWSGGNQISVSGIPSEEVCYCKKNQVAPFLCPNIVAKYAKNYTWSKSEQSKVYFQSKTNLPSKYTKKLGFAKTYFQSTKTLFFQRAKV